MQECRVFFDDPQSGPTNMAIDEALLSLAHDSKYGGGLRFYGWCEPTVSLGYFQRFSDRQTHWPSTSCAIVRRATGGGAIVHDHELTYSFTCESPNRSKTEVRDLYDAFHGTLVEQLTDFGITATICSEADPRPAGEQPFLCFQRRAIGDVLIGDHKIGGSAQRRYRGGLLQHGSILLTRSAAAPELPGIFELTGVRLSAERLAENWCHRLGRALKRDFESAALSAFERQLAGELERDKFGAATWNQRR